jgi:hypothetical protein
MRPAEAFMCYNHCPDIAPHSCGLGVCARDGNSCRDFVLGAVGCESQPSFTVAACQVGPGSTNKTHAAPCVKCT